MRSEYVYPTLADRASVDEWVAAGAPSLWDRAHTRVKEIVDAGRPDHLPTSAEAAIRDRFDIQLATFREVR
jgi:trimethylamine--corrinoid protein Co-methyltransferase